MKKALVVTLLFCLGQAVLAQSHAPKKSPKNVVKYNVLFISIDDLRPELGAYGKKYIYSPNIDKIAANGITFDRAYCQMAFCNPSRASLLTGLRPDAIAVYDLATHFRKKIPQVVTLPEYFKQHGYFTASFNKIFHLRDEQSWSEPSWHSKIHPAVGYALPENIAMAKNNKGRGPLTEKADVPDNAYVDGEAAEKAIATLRRVKDKPFFMAVGFYRPHIPFAVPKKYWDLYDPAKIIVPAAGLPKNIPDVAYIGLGTGELGQYTDGQKESRQYRGAQASNLIHGYYASVSYVDAQVGKLLQELKALGLEKNTIIVLWGDHGWKLGEYGEWGKRSNMELDLRAPLIFSSPNMKVKNQRSNALVEFIDIYPTLCQEAGLPVPGGLQGKSFSKILANPQSEFKTTAFSQVGRAPDNMGYSMRTYQFRYTQWVNTKNPDKIIATELYDHLKDPGETINVAANPAYAGELKKLQKLFNQSEK